MGWRKEKPVPPLPPVPKNMGYNVDYEELDKFLINKEKFSPDAYQVKSTKPDGTTHLGQWTIGYGNEFYEDGSRVRKGDTINEAEAHKLMRFSVNQGLEQLEKEPTFQKMNINQKTGMASFAYNLGPYFMESVHYPNLQKAVRSGDVNEIHRMMRKFIYSDGVPMEGLRLRREAEIDLMNLPLSSDDSRYD